MKIQLHPEVLRLLHDSGEDVERAINDIAYVYLTGGFLRRADIALHIEVDNVFRKRSDNLMPVFHSITQKFIGVSVIGKTDSETLWIPSPKLHDALEANKELIVMKSPRDSGIRIKLGKDIEDNPVPRDRFC